MLAMMLSVVMIMSNMFYNSNFSTKTILVHNDASSTEDNIFSEDLYLSDEEYSAYSLDIIQNLPLILNEHLQYSVSSVKLRRYFENLTENYGANITETCGYVALGSMLTYFDTYWDDRIIPEKYEVNPSMSCISDVLEVTSPGSFYDDTLLNSSELLYKAECLRTSDVNLHSLLVSQNSSLSISAYDTEEVFKNFLASSYDNAFVYISYEFDSDLSTSQKNQLAMYYSSLAIDRGIPVKLSLYNPSRDRRHSVVAHSYSANTLYCHFGWNSSLTSVPFNYDGYYSEIYALTLVVPRMPHYHSNNYVIEHEDGFKYFYCPCPETLGHTHNFSTYEEIDESGHLAICSICNEENMEPHMLTGETYKTCVKCGWTNYFDEFIPIM